MTANKRRFSWGAVLLVLLAVCLVYYLASGLRSQDAVSYAQVRQLFLDEKVQEFAISDTRLTAKLSDGGTVSCDLYDFQVFYDDLNDLVRSSTTRASSGIIPITPTIPPTGCRSCCRMWW